MPLEAHGRTVLIEDAEPRLDRMFHTIETQT